MNRAVALTRSSGVSVVEGQNSKTLSELMSCFGSSKKMPFIYIEFIFYRHPTFHLACLAWFS